MQAGTGQSQGADTIIGHHWSGVAAACCKLAAPVSWGQPTQPTDCRHSPFGWHWPPDGQGAAHAAVPVHNLEALRLDQRGQTVLGQSHLHPTAQANNSLAAGCVSWKAIAGQQGTSAGAPLIPETRFWQSGAWRTCCSPSSTAGCMRAEWQHCPQPPLQGHNIMASIHAHLPRRAPSTQHVLVHLDWLA